MGYSFGGLIALEMARTMAVTVIDGEHSELFSPAHIGTTGRAIESSLATVTAPSM